MNEYRIEIVGGREKVALIKMIRTFGTFGLKACKDLVEDAVSFDEWLDKDVRLKIIVTAEQLGNRYAWETETERHDGYMISSAELIKPARADIDITELPER